METKIINEDENKGTVIIDSNETESSGTVIIDNTETQIIDSQGTQIIDNSETVIIDKSDKNESSVDNSITPNTIKNLTGNPIAKDVIIDSYKIKNQMDTKSGEADLFIATINNDTVIFKYYRNSHKPKTSVVFALKSKSISRPKSAPDEEE